MTLDTSAALASRRANLAGSLSTAALLVLMTLSGALYLVSPAPLLRALQPLGYPAYFLRLLRIVTGAILMGSLWCTTEGPAS